MTDEIFEKILEEIAPHKTAVRFIRWGEPTIHKRFLWFLTEVKLAGCLCHFNTNGQNMTNQSAMQIVNTGVDSIKVSFQGEKAEHEKYRGKGTYDKAVDAVRMLGRTRGNRALPYIQIGLTTAYKEPVFEKLVRDVGGENADEIFYGKTLDLNLPVESVTGCPEVFSKLSVDFDGTITACCSDYDRFMSLGNIKEMTLQEAWKGKKLAAIREMLVEGKSQEMPLCSHCPRK